MKRLLLAAAAAASLLGLAQAATEKAVFAQGCFWCAEAAFEGEPGVLDVVSGYTGGAEANPTYEQVSYGATGHYEAIEVTYDSEKVSYDRLLTIFWTNVDPFDASGQFCDKGPHYRAAIFATPAQREAAERSLGQMRERFRGREIATQVLDAQVFWPAEDYHQDYHVKQASRYGYYRFACGRDARLDEVWGADARAGKPAKE